MSGNLDGVEAQRGSAATYVADAGSVRYRKEVTDDNNDSPVIGEWSNAVTVEAASNASQTPRCMVCVLMQSDKHICTKLRAGSGTGTISYWIKTAAHRSWCGNTRRQQTGAAYPAEIGAGYDGYME